MPIPMTHYQRKAYRLATELLVRIGPSIAHNSTTSRWLSRTVERRIRAHHAKHAPLSPLPKGVLQERLELWLILLHTIQRALAEDRLAPSVIRGLLKLLVETLLLEGGECSAAARFAEQYGTNPPALLTISPGKACNLHCPGCWADAGHASEKLPWNVVDRIIKEAKELWGARFFVLTGGEPLAYRSEGHDVIDLAAKHPDCFFMMYTNGTLVSNEIASRLAEIGNLTPAVSLEGWRETTDARRGEGVFEKVALAMERLRQHGVLFGISLTATRHNFEEILSDDFVTYCFDDMGALYGWIFQYMPIGRSVTLELLPTPEQRLWMWQRIRDLARERQIFFADFWNQGTLTEGCIAAGRSTGGGYLYIDWNGAVSPCVFLPFSPVNIKEVYAQGGTLNDVWADPFFAGIREWQKNYKQARGNWMMPCPNRDHHAELRRLIAEHEPDPLDENAREALLDPEYARGLEQYDAAYQEMTEDIWQREYLGVPAKQ